MGRIVLCGSMSAIDRMRICAQALAAKYEPVLPGEDGWSGIPASQTSAHKRAASRKHFDEIAAAGTVAVLVVNEAKNGRENYIGANTFAEIAIAFYLGRRVYLLNGFYEPCLDELLAWGCVPLEGDLTPLVTAE